MRWLKWLRTKWITETKAVCYLEKNKKLSYLDTLIFNFTEQLYLYLINPNAIEAEEAERKIYENYINLINISLRNNKEEPDQKILDIFLHRGLFIVNRELHNTSSFIILNIGWHHEYLKKALASIRHKSSPDNYGYMNWEQFQTELRHSKELFTTKKNKGQK